MLVLWMESWDYLIYTARELLESVGFTFGIRDGKLACTLWAASRDHE